MIESFNELKNVKKYYDFLVDIKNIDNFKKYYNKEVEVIHKHCKTKIKVKLKYLFNDVIDNVKISSLTYLKDYFNNKLDMKCPVCIQEAKNKYFSDQLKEKFGDKYILKSDFKGMSSDVDVIHVPCQTVLTRNAGRLLSVRGESINCPTCASFLNRSEKQRYKNIMNITDKFEFDEDVENIYVFKECLEKEIDVTHKKCGHKFKIKLNKFFNAKMNTIENLTNEKNKDDVICPRCMQKLKNKYFQNLLSKKTKKQFDLESDYISATKRVVVKHKVCGETMTVASGNVFCRDWACRCTYCANLLTPSERRKFDACNKLKKYYEFPFDITETFLFKKFIDTEIEIKHKKCGRTFDIKLGDFNKLSINKDGYLNKYIEDVEDAKCPHCLQDTKNKYFEDLLHENYGTQYSIVGNYLSTKEDVSVIHNPCGRVITLNASIITRQRRKRTSICDCSEDIRQQQIQKEKNESFVERMKEEGASDFEFLEDYVDRTTDILFRHKTCGYEFMVSPDNFLKRVNKCPNCTGVNRVIFKDQKEKNEVFQKRLDENVQGFKLVGDYINKMERVTLYHERCHKEFSVDMVNFEETGYKCSYCETKKYKYSKDITLKEKIKCFEREWDYEYKVLTGFVNVTDVAKLRHRRCGKTFETQIVNVISRKDKSTACPHCELEKRKKIFLKKLEGKFGDSFKMVGEYVSEKTETEFEHVCCKKRFMIKPARLVKQKLEYCPECKDEVQRLNNFNKFKNKLKEKHGKDYSILTEYKSYDEKALFKHNDCETMFWETPFNILKKDIPCSHCHKTENRWIPIEEVNKRIRKSNGDKFKIVGIYKGTENSTVILCTDCGHEMVLSPVKLFRAKKCPKCDMEKRKQEFLDKMYNKFGDEFKMYGSYTSIEEPAEFVHKPCGVKFKMIPKQMLSKVVACCPECKNEVLKKHYSEINFKKFKNRLVKKHGNKYEVVGDYVNLETEVLFRDNVTGEEFKAIPGNILRKKDIDI